METTQKLHISLLFTSFDLHLGQREAGKCGTCLCRHMPNNNAPITLQQNGFGGWLLSVRALRFFLLCWCPLCTGIPPFFPIQFFLAKTCPKDSFSPEDMSVRERQTRWCWGQWPHCFPVCAHGHLSQTHIPQRVAVTVCACRAPGTGRDAFYRWSNYPIVWFTASLWSCLREILWAGYFVSLLCSPRLVNVLCLCL